MGHQVGDRVLAVLCADEDTVYLFGHGVYSGEEVPDHGPLHDLGVENAKITLDNGQVVWGFECWWGPEANFEKLLAGRKIEVVDPETYRKLSV